MSDRGQKVNILHYFLKNVDQNNKADKNLNISKNLDRNNFKILQNNFKAEQSVFS